MPYTKLCDCFVSKLTMNSTPALQTRQCLCGSSQSPVLTCAAQAPEDIQEAARKALASNGQTAGTTPTSSSGGAPQSDSAAPAAETTAEPPTSAPAAPGPPLGGNQSTGGGQCITPTGSVAGEPASNPSAG